MTWLTGLQNLSANTVRPAWGHHRRAAKEHELATSPPWSRRL